VAIANADLLKTPLWYLCQGYVAMTGLIQQSNRGYFQTTILLHQMNENPVHRGAERFCFGERSRHSKSIESLEMGRSILPHSFHSSFNCSNSPPLVGCCYFGCCYLLLLNERSAERSERAGQFLVEPPFEIAWNFSEGVVTADKNSKFGYLNTATQLIIPHQFPFFRQFF
jgi:hypothetical protein